MFCVPQVDEVIQDALFKVEDDSAQMTALLGFVDIQGLFDKRVKKLFEDELECRTPPRIQPQPTHITPTFVFLGNEMDAMNK